MKRARVLELADRIVRCVETNGLSDTLTLAQLKDALCDMVTEQPETDVEAALAELVDGSQGTVVATATATCPKCGAIVTAEIREALHADPPAPPPYVHRGRRGGGCDPRSSD